MSSLCFLAAGMLVNGVPDTAKSIEPLISPDSLLTVADAINHRSTSTAPTQTAFSPESLGPEFSSPTCDPKQNLHIADQKLQSNELPNLTDPRSNELSFIRSVMPAQSLPLLATPDPNTAAKPVTTASMTPPAKVAKVNDVTSNLRELVDLLTPRSGSQLYLQRLAALKTGRLHTRIASDSFHSIWKKATLQPTYQQWKQLLAQEAKAAANGQGSNRLSLMVGDSLSLWFPSNRLPSGQFWLNQGISGDTSGGTLRRLSAFSQVKADTIYLMVGINDLRRGFTDEDIVNNQLQIIEQLRQSHPQAEIVVQSILPTDLPAISNIRIQGINQRLAVVAQQVGITYLDLYALFIDQQGNLNPELTTDGLHLNARGYEMWQWALNQVDSRLAADWRARQAMNVAGYVKAS